MNCHARILFGEGRTHGVLLKGKQLIGLSITTWVHFQDGLFTARNIDAGGGGEWIDNVVGMNL